MITLGLTPPRARIARPTRTAPIRPIAWARSWRRMRPGRGRSRRRSRRSKSPRGSGRARWLWRPSRPKTPAPERLPRPSSSWPGGASRGGGQVVFDLEVDAGGALALIPCAAATVLLGSPDPASWIYSLQCYGPSSTVTRYRPRDGVVHLQYGREATRPWEGRAPWQTAHLSGTLLAGVERQLAGESASASGYVVPMPDVGDRGQGADADGEADPLSTLRYDMAGHRERRYWCQVWPRDSAAGRPCRLPRHRNISPVALARIRPPRLSSSGAMSSGASCRATAFCRVCFMSGRPAPHYARPAGKRTPTPPCPIAQLVAAQLSEALDESITLTLPRATDVATLSRAIGSLVTAGVEVGEARAIVGI